MMTKPKAEEVPDTMALPPTQDLEAQAMRQRLDLQIAQRDTAATAAALGLTRASRFVNVLDAGYINKSSNAPRANGYEISFELPLFDWGDAKTAKAEALYMLAFHRSADTAIRARSQVRETYSAYRSAYDLARHYRDEVVPLYYQRDRDGLPRGWIKRMKRTIRTLGWLFNANRMVMDYTLKCYVPAAGGTSSDMSRTS